ncbi:hypothetical protein HPB51_007147 [Rhipicephalus microplus]|uniref:Zinc finger RING-type eukaryotic domain-containing protein n=1 Tax=Rhipicephalus microplus TaxID=6941 RepID=A0A9J6E014_RHIMP|nr:hypothetical protein HPB51_007147 [Rhipicephalus microplus]
MLISGPPDAVIYASPAFLVLIGSVANQLPRALDGGTEVEQEGVAAPAAGEDGLVEPGVSPNSFAAAGRYDASSNHSKNIVLSAGDRVSRTVKSITKSELFEEAVVLQCGHTFCSACINTLRKFSCLRPLCAAPIRSVTRSSTVDNITDKLVALDPELKAISTGFGTLEIGSFRR